jgi:hypothetical protein
MVSKSSRVYKLSSGQRGTPDRPVPVNITQRIAFTRCVNEPAQAESSRFENLVLEVSRNFIVYDAQDEIVRFASTQRILPRATAGDDPCKQGAKKCGPNSSCIAVGSSFDCACHKG